MSVYNDQINDGSFWLRKVNGSIESSVESLSSIFEKYRNVNSYFYNDLINNNIKNFDVFYDVIFIETNNGYIIEKFYIDNDYKVYPYNNNNFFTRVKNTTTKYWFDEKKLKVYFVDLVFDVQEVDSLQFVFLFKEFDCKTGFLYSRLQERFYFKFTSSTDWGRKIPDVETPVITYNNNTNKFNVSFIFRNNTYNIALFSIMIEDINLFEVVKVDSFIPFAKIDYQNSYHISL